MSDHYRSHLHLIALRDRILVRHQSAAKSRARHADWIERERQVVADAANGWAFTRGLPGRVTVEDVERIEVQAVGHVDYMRKLALYVAEFVLAPPAPSSPVNDEAPPV